MLHPLYEVLTLLDDAGIHYRLGRYLPDAVTVLVTVVGGRHEINVDASGAIQTSSFEGSEDLVEGIGFVETLIEANRD